jgi:lipopolysaccharide transport system ATP-binding protein
MSTVIKVEALSKCYLLDHRQGPAYGTLREALAKRTSRVADRLIRPSGREQPVPGGGNAREQFWALRDVEFEVERGERVGIIGRNGAGKSTLLKILSRITEPTKGRIELSGRVASLLEVGTGFHPELTGRENIFLNGAILGMSRTEVTRKFDEIVAFAEVERFLDTPVKRYSSGMYVRLAFAVAAHLEPEVLIIDEVLAVGDRQFQDKCLGRIEELSRGAGKTILLVSHNLDVIQRVCDRALYLRQGAIAFDGSAAAALHDYVASTTATVSSISLALRSDRYGSQNLVASGFGVVDAHGVRQNVLQSGGDYTFVVECRKRTAVECLNGVNTCIELKDARNVTVWLAASNFTRQSFTVDDDEIFIRCSVRDLNLATGSYSVTLFLSQGEHQVLDCIHDAATLTVAGGDYFGTGSPGLPDHCSTLTRVEWRASRAGGS